MILSNFLSRLAHDYSNLHEILLVTFNVQEVLHARYYNVHEIDKENYFV